MLPEALQKGQKEIQSRAVSGKKQQLQGKEKTKILMRELLKHREEVKQLNNDNNILTLDRKNLKRSLTCQHLQFKKERITKKVNRVIARVHLELPPNMYQRRVVQTLTPLIERKIQYGKLKKKYNMQQIRSELTARGLSIKFDEKTNWTTLIKLLKEHEKDKKYFKPLTSYDSFKWNSIHFDNSGNLINTSL